VTDATRAALAITAISAHHRAWARRVVPDLVVGLVRARETWRARALAAESEVGRLRRLVLLDRDTLQSAAEEGGP
jgi:hypothetical protein